MNLIKLRKNAEKKTVRGYPWIWANEIDQVSPSLTPGSIADVFDSENKFLGKGYYNPSSSITVRFLTRRDEPINLAFIKRTIDKAWYQRKLIYPLENCLRVFFSEADGIPGLVIDKYEDAVVFQLSTLGADKMRDLILESVIEIFNPSFVVERSDSPIRLKEGLEQFKGCVYGKIDRKKPVRINGVLFSVDLLEAQKTGFFLDQRENYTLLSGFSNSKRVLDAFCNNGAFGIHAAFYGAKEVVFLDCSKKSLETAEENFSLGSFSASAYFVKADAVSYLKKMEKTGEKFDVIILDPPAFIKDRKKIKQGVKGYKEINMRAMDMLSDEGFLVSCSCSQHLDVSSFISMLKSASADRRTSFDLLSLTFQPKDHPALLPMEDFWYLKCAVLRKTAFNNRIFP